MSLGTKIDLFLNYKIYGKDEFGNKYYISKKVDPVSKKQKRMVWYNGMAEASKVPPVWHAWLHNMIDEVNDSDLKKYDWQVDYLPNLSGTSHAYRPPGHISQGGKREQVSSDYKPWKPDEEQR